MKMRLNPDQDLAARTLDRPVVVTAGAGSGKTRLLTQRFINAVSPGAVSEWHPASVDEILAITFTDKAAGELAERVRCALRAARLVEEARGVDNAWVSTIHGLCSRLLRRHALEAGVDPLFSVADTVVAGNLRAEAFEQAVLGLLSESAEVAQLIDAYPVAAILSAVSTLMRELAVHGLDVNAIEFEQAAGFAALLGDAVELFEHGCCACAGYEGTAKAAPEFTERCSDLLERARELEKHSSEDEALGVLARLVGEYKPLRTLKGLEEASSESRELAARLAGAVGAALVAPHSRALVELTGAFGLRFEALKRAAGVLDFDDLQVLAVELLETRPEVARRYRERFRLVMIDEFQDTDALQLRLVEALSAGDLCTVGDEKQSIYRFRGADVGVYRTHRAAMREAGALEVPLGVNYRSHRDVLSFVNAVFSSQEYFDGDLLRLTPPDDLHEPRPCNEVLGRGRRVEALFVDSSGFGTQMCRESEARVIAVRLGELASAGVGAGDVAILVRSYSSAHVYAEALAEIGLPAVIVGGSRFFGLPEIAVMRALTRAIANPSDGEALGELLVSEFCPVSDDGLARLRLGGDMDRRPLWQLLSEERGRLGEDDAAAAGRLVGLIARARAEIGTRPLSDVVLGAVEDAGWDLRLLSAGNSGRDAFANVLKFARLAETFESGGASGPAGFASYLDAKESLGDAEAPAAVADDGVEAVRIMSVHASKGLEFPVVVVPDLASQGRRGGSIVRTSAEPGRLRMALAPPSTDDGTALPKSSWARELATLDDEAEAEESDRVLYVAFTRAQELLIASGSAHLQPKSASVSRSHLHRLARLLGVKVPIDGTCDREVRLDDAGQEVQVRVRVLDGTESADIGPVPEHVAPGDRKATVAVGRRFEGSPPVAVAPLRTSYSRLHLFERCPRRYLLEDVIGFRRADEIQSGDVDPTRFGSALHAVLQLAHRGVLPSDGRIGAISRQFELDDDGCARLQAAAESFVRSGTALRVDSADRVVHELAFALPIASGACVLGGAIDVYARSGGSALIVDYKSGTSGDERDLPARYALQATCYALAALADGADEIEVVFTRPEVPTADGTPQEVSYNFRREDERRLRDRIDSIHARIASDDFLPLDVRDETICGSCPAPSGLCPNARW